MHVLAVQTQHEQQQWQYGPEHELELVVPDQVQVRHYLESELLLLLLRVAVQVLAQVLVGEGAIELYRIPQRVAIDARHHPQ